VKPHPFHEDLSISLAGVEHQTWVKASERLDTSSGLTKKPAASPPQAAMDVNRFISIASYKSKLSAAIIATQQPNLQGNYQNYPQFR